MNGFPVYGPRPLNFPAKHWVPTPPQPAGCWVWVPDVPPAGCPACAQSGVCMCVRPGSGPTLTCTVTSTATIKIN